MVWLVNQGFHNIKHSMRQNLPICCCQFWATIVMDPYKTNKQNNICHALFTDYNNSRYRYSSSFQHLDISTLYCALYGNARFNFQVNLPSFVTTCTYWLDRNILDIRLDYHHYISHFEVALMVTFPLWKWATLLMSLSATSTVCPVLFTNAESLYPQQMFVSQSRNVSFDAVRPKSLFQKDQILNVQPSAARIAE